MRQLDQQFANFPKAMRFNDGLSKPTLVKATLRTFYGPCLLSELIRGATDIPTCTQGEFAIVLSHLASRSKHLCGNVVCDSHLTVRDAATLNDQHLFSRNKRRMPMKPCEHSCLCWSVSLEAIQETNSNQYVVSGDNIQ